MVDHEFDTDMKCSDSFVDASMSSAATGFLLILTLIVPKYTRKQWSSEFFRVFHHGTIKDSGRHSVTALLGV